ncbi:MAG: MmgE/PrpD family protein [Xanthobacteraceae bacterium]|jgi:2-methylcitrate dehydratase PrpD|nr:MmgE/PrpD family protein [Xanthobacteraceae bacterium]
MLLEQLSQRAIAVRLDDVPEDALTTARFAILDTIGVTLAGASEPCTAIAGRALGATGRGAASLFGRAARVAPLDAATINGTASHALDFDDCSNSMGGHPSAPVVPALWAIAEQDGAGGAVVLEAYVAGVEVETKIARAVNFHHYEKGWHPTATLGTFGAAAACAKLMQLEAPAFTNALAIACSMASGLKANFGTMTKPFHVGQCARNGLYSALLAREGMSANPAAMEDPQGFLMVFNGEGKFDAARMIDEFAAPYDLVEPGIAFKRHPCCASTHPAIDALLRITAEHDLKASDIAAIRSWTHPRRLRHTNRPNPQSGLDGKFSVQYVLARAALDGSVRLDHFDDAAVHDRQVRAFMARIVAEPHPESVMESTEHFFAEVEVTTTSGETLRAYVDRPLGRDRAHPLPPGALETKFRDCAAPVIAEDAVHAIEAAILSLEDQVDIRAIGDVMRDGLRHAEPRRAAFG